MKSVKQIRLKKKTDNDSEIKGAKIEYGGQTVDVWKELWGYKKLKKGELWVGKTVWRAKVIETTLWNRARKTKLPLQKTKINRK